MKFLKLDRLLNETPDDLIENRDAMTFTFLRSVDDLDTTVPGPFLKSTIKVFSDQHWDTAEGEIASKVRFPCVLIKVPGSNGPSTVTLDGGCTDLGDPSGNGRKLSDKFGFSMGMKRPAHVQLLYMMFAACLDGQSFDRFLSDIERQMTEPVPKFRAIGLAGRYTRTHISFWKSTETDLVRSIMRALEKGAEAGFADTVTCSFAKSMFSDDDAHKEKFYIEKHPKGGETNMNRRFEEAVERILEDGGAMSAGPGGAMGTPDTPGQYGKDNDARLPWGNKRIARRGTLEHKKKKKKA